VRRCLVRRHAGCEPGGRRTVPLTNDRGVYRLDMCPDQGPRADSTLQLIHPVYVDTPMLVSFIAALEGGVSYGDERTERHDLTEAKEREGGARFGLPLLSSSFNLDMSGRLAQRDTEQNSAETRIVRRHTEASLLNLLRHRLVADGVVKSIGDTAGLEGLSTGDLVEITGEVIGNPLQQMFALMQQILPYLGKDESEIMKPAKPANRSRKTQGAGGVDSGADDDPNAAFRMMLIMRNDLESAAVRDIVLIAESGVRAVLTMSKEFFGTQTTDYVLAGRFTALGKVTRVLADGENINLTRRTALGMGGPDLARELIRDVGSESPALAAIGDPIVEPPGIQLLPLAVFV
jgi:hypothetical protein